MPPFIHTDCPHCHQKNRFDLPELLKSVGEVYRGDTQPTARTIHEIAVHCQHCHRPFKVSVPVERRAP